MSCKALGGAFSFAALQVPPQPGSAPPHTALPPLRQTLAPAHSTQASSQQTLAPMQSSLAQPRLPTEPVRQGSDSLRSSDEFPANKENSHGQWPPLERRAAPVAKAVATAGSGAHAAGVVSEQVLAQEAVYALQVTAVNHLLICLSGHLSTHHRRSDTALLLPHPRQKNNIYVSRSAVLLTEAQWSLS